MKEVQNTHSKLLLCRPFVCVCVLISIIFLFYHFFFFLDALSIFQELGSFIHFLYGVSFNSTITVLISIVSFLCLRVFSLSGLFFFFFSFLFTVAQFSHCFSFFFFSFLLYLVSVFFFGAFLFQEGAVGCVIHKFCFCRRSTWTERWDKGIKNCCRILGRLISSNKTVRSQTKV